VGALFGALALPVHRAPLAIFWTPKQNPCQGRLPGGPEDALPARALGAEGGHEGAVPTAQDGNVGVGFVQVVACGEVRSLWSAFVPSGFPIDQPERSPLAPSVALARKGLLNPLQRYVARNLSPKSALHATTRFDVGEAAKNGVFL